MCGFDSVPSDLGTWLLVRAIRDRCVRAILSLNSSPFYFFLKNKPSSFNRHLLSFPSASTLSSVLSPAEEPFSIPPLVQPNPKSTGAGSVRARGA